MKKIIACICKHAKLTIFIVLALSALFGYYAMHVRVNASYSAFVPWSESSDMYQGGRAGQTPILSKAPFSEEDYIPSTTVSLGGNYYASNGEEAREEKLPDYRYTTNYLVLVKGDNLYEPEVLNKIEQCINALSETRELSEASSVLDFVTFEKRGTRLATVPMAPSHEGGWDKESAAIFKARVENDPVSEFFLVGRDKKSILFTFRISNLSDARLEELSAMLDPLRSLGLEIYINGGQVINHKVLEYLYKDFTTLIVLCLLVILIVYYLCFHSKRSVLLPLSLSLIALVWTIGTMTLLDIPLSILTVVTPCMVITLGSAYCIHVLSEYYANWQREKPLPLSLSVANIVKTILFATLTTVCGFLALAAAKTSGLKDLGISVSAGIAYCAILACTYLPACLSLMKTPRQKQIESFRNGFMAKLVKGIGNVVIKYWKLLLLVLLVIIVGFALVHDKISVDSNYMSYFPKSDQFGQDSRTFAREIGGDNSLTVTISAPNGSERFFLQSENLKKVYEYEEAALASDDVLQSISFSTYVAHANYLMTGERKIPETSGLMNMLSRLVILMQNQSGQSLSSIISEDGNRVELNIRHWDGVEQDLMTTSSITRIMEILVGNLDMLPDGTCVTISGGGIANAKFSNRLISDQNRSTLLSILIVFLLTAIAFRSLSNALYTMVPIFSGIMINYIFMFLMNIPFDMITVSFSSIAIGCGVDDAIHFILRYKNKKKAEKERTVSELLRETIAETGRPIILTTVSIVAGMLMLSFASYTPIRYFGLLMSVTLFSCMLSTITFMPSAIILADEIKRKLNRRKQSF